MPKEKPLEFQVILTVRAGDGSDVNPSSATQVRVAEEVYEKFNTLVHALEFCIDPVVTIQILIGGFE